MSTKYLHEVLEEINNDTNLLRSLYRPINGGGPLATVFKHAFLPEFKFLLPPGTPPYNREETPLGFSPSKIQSEIRRFYVFTDPNIASDKRENVFIQMLESIPTEEIKILIAIKDQNLTSLYSRINRKMLESTGYLPPLEVSDVVEPSSTDSVDSTKPNKRPTRSPSRKPPLDLSQL